MRKLMVLFWCIALITICFNGLCQYKKNAIVLELLGKSVIPFDLSYERYFSERFLIGGGIGMPTKTKFQDISPVGNGTLTPNFYTFDVPVYCGYSFGQKKHHLNSELGIAFVLSTENKHANLLGTLPFISLGYEFKGENYVFSIPVYFALRDAYNDSRQIVPWIGLSLGRLF